MIWEVLTLRGRYGALTADHPGVGDTCPGCGDKLEVGDVPSLVNGVPYDEEQIEKALAGRAHNVECKLAHERCAYP